MKTRLAILALALVASTPAAAKTTTFDCKLAQITRQQKGEKLEDLTFQVTLDTKTGKAEIVGENSPGGVRVLAGSEAVTFLQLYPTGSMRATTVSRDGSAIQTRHVLVHGQVIPTLFYGRCR